MKNDKFHPVFYMKISAKTQNELMACIPHRILEWDYQDNSELIYVKKPKFESDWAKKIFEPFFKTKFFKARLDKLGTVVWQNCDGKNTVKQIGEILAKTFGPEIEPIYERLNEFIVNLHRHKFIEITCPQ
jgi:hypothetical protein